MPDKVKEIKRISIMSLAFMAFTSVWGFQNLINGFYYFNGIKAALPWLCVMVLYFLPYAFMVGELGSSFKTSSGGVSGWVGKTLGPKFAYLAGWTYWVVQLPYLSQKPENALIAASWASFQDSRISDLNPVILQSLCLLLFLFAIFVAQRGVKVLSKVASIAGVAAFTLSILFILMMVAAPAITNGEVQNIEWSWETFKPNFSLDFFGSISILILAVGGCEMISPYANKMRRKDGFSKGVIMVAIMVAVCAVLGTFALGMMYGPNNVPQDFVTNGAYYAFQKLGVFYFGDAYLGAFPLSNLFVVLYGISFFTSQFSVMMISIDAPLRMLLNEPNKQFLPKALFKKNKNDVLVNGYLLVAVIVSILIAIPAAGIGSVNEIVKAIVKLISICMPFGFCWVFIAYIFMKKDKEKYPSEYNFIKNKPLAIFIGLWCLVLTVVSCIIGMYSQDPFQLMLNIFTPIFLFGLGILFLFISNAKNKKLNSKLDK